VFRRLCVRISSKQPIIGYVGGHFCGNLGDELMFECFIDQWHPAAVETLDTPRVEEFLSKLGVPMVAIGTGVGSCGKEQRGDVSFSEWKPVLSRFDSVWLRGPISVQRLKSIGLNGVKMCGDVALLLFEKVELNPCANRIAINVLKEPMTDDSLREIVALVIPELKRRGFVIDAWVLNQDDIPYTKELIGEHADRVLIMKTHQDIIDAAKHVRFSICTRLHASVFSVMRSVPTILLAYRDKCLDFMQSVGLEGSCVDLLAEDCFEHVLQQVELHFDDEYLKCRHSKLCEGSSLLKERVLAAMNSVLDDAIDLTHK
jgi:polysaccharide pyruvyl transferase WcaK-like protein